ncbi:MAG: hypothetical protein K2G63_03130 [Oscillospiraceae bacterium]|nr:hypothetical protein [Oscillospiraceae bacterium]
MKAKIILAVCLMSILAFTGCGSTNNEIKENSSVSESQEVSHENNSESEAQEISNKDNSTSETTIDRNKHSHGIVNYANRVIFYNGTAYADEITDDFKYSKEYLDEHLPEAYSVVYHQNKSGGSTREKALTITKDGVYSSDGEHENLYIKKDDNTYYSYNNYESDIFTKISIDRDADTVKAWTNVDSYIYPYSPSIISHNLTGTETVCGVECEVYECPIEVTVKDAEGNDIQDTENYHITVYVEPQTGFCLKYTSNLGEETGDNDFECIEFKIEDVTLPDYQDEAVRNPDNE